MRVVPARGGATRIAALILALLAAPAHAALTQVQLDRVAADPPAGARLDLGTGKPTVLIFADVDCGALCDAALAQTTADLAAAGLAPEDYALAVIGLDPRDRPAAAAAFVARQAAPLDPERIVIRTPDEAGLAAMTAALGYRYAYDASTDSFAHPAARYVLDPDGAVVRVLPALTPAPRDLARALTEAAPAGLGEQLALLCYAFDPATGRYSPAILRATTILSILTAIGVFGAIGAAHLRERRLSR